MYKPRQLALKNKGYKKSLMYKESEFTTNYKTKQFSTFRVGEKKIFSV